ncbi:MAG: P-loop NTPase, partial [Acholeplasmataceae bacterium]
MRDLEKLKKDLENFIDPSLKLTFKEGKSILDFKLDGDVIDLKIALKNLRRDEEKVKLEIARLVKITHGFLGLRIEFLQSKYKGLEKEPIYLGIISGKGGVGKSTVAANLAVALSRLNQKVGIIDADIYGSSLPSIFKLPIKPLKTSKDDLVIPAIYEGIEVISPEFFMPENQPLMWRGPMLGKLLEHFFDSVLWQDDLDFIIIDLPPGTGDIQLDVENHVPEALM